MSRTKDKKVQADRALSHWGWGFADRFPGRSKRMTLSAQMRLALGFGLGLPRNPRRLRDADVPRRRVDVPVRLEGLVVGDDEARVRHTYGRAYRDILRGFRGDFSPAPDLVATPTSEDEIDAVLSWADGADVAVVPYGGGTNVVGSLECAAETHKGVLSLDLRRLDQVVEVDDVSLSARIQAGATGPALERQLAEHGLTLRHYPQSFEFSTLGGWLATRSGGHFATGYTHIDDFVQSIRMLTPVGVSESLRLPASGAGPSPDRLVLGSEGAFGVLTEAWMRVQHRPRHRSKASLFFRTFEDGAAAVRAIVQSGLRPANCRLLDGTEAKLHRVTGDGRSVLILGFESSDHEVRERLEIALRLAMGHGGRCPDGAIHTGPADEARRAGAPGASGTWRQAFFDAPYLQSSLVSFGVLADTFETATTWDKFADLHAELRTEVVGALHRLCGDGRFSCRFTHAYPDGPAPYYTFLGPVARGAELATWAEIKEVASSTLRRHGATITHHHAVGRVHRAAYLEQVPAPVLGALRAAKRAFDPRGLLNPGVAFDGLAPTAPEETP